MLFLATFASCSSNEEPSSVIEDEKWTPSATPSGFKKIYMPEEGVAVTDAENDFSFRFFNKAASYNGYTNTIVSPLNLFLHLGILANGDSGISREEILKTMGKPGEPASIEAVNLYSEYLLKALPDLDAQARCAFSSSFWYGYGNPSEAFQKGSSIFGTELRNESPMGEKSMQKINNWINDNTGGLIPNFLETPLTSDVLLMNTTYFAGLWSNEFIKSNNREDTFYCKDGSEARATFMTQRISGVQYFNAEGIIGTSLRFGSGNFSMLALMPENPATGIEEMISSLDLDKYKKFLDSSRDVLIDLEMPKFNSKFKHEINDILKAMGISGIFNIGLDSIFEEQEGLLQINCHYHGAVFTIDEQGVKAAAVDVSDLVGAAPPQTEPEHVELKFNRPFVYLLREVSTGSILFMGCVTSL